MTKRTRRTHAPAFKAKVALAAIKGEKTLLLKLLRTYWKECHQRVAVSRRPARAAYHCVRR